MVSYETKGQYLVVLFRFLKELDLYYLREYIKLPSFYCNVIGNYAYAVMHGTSKEKRVVADVLWNKGMLKKTPHYTHDYYKQSMDNLAKIYGRELMSEIAKDLEREDFSFSDLSNYKKYFA